MRLLLDKCGETGTVKLLDSEAGFFFFLGGGWSSLDVVGEGVGLCCFLKGMICLFLSFTVAIIADLFSFSPPPEKKARCLPDDEFTFAFSSNESCPATD